MQVSIKLEYIKESLRAAGNSWHTWAIADESGGRASGWNGSRHPVPTPEPATMNQYDNGKLIGFIQEHNIKVLACTHNTITVESQYCKDGKHYTEAETIRATMPAVRDYLGY